MKKRRKDLKPSELAALQAEENAAALEALRKRREKEHKKMMRSKGSNKRVGKSWKNDVGIFLLLTITGLFMIFPIYLAVVNSIKPVQEVFLMPPKLYAMDPTFDNFKDLFKIANNSWVPFSRNIFNSIYVTVVATIFHVLFASTAAFVLSKCKFPGAAFMALR